MASSFEGGEIPPVNHNNHLINEGCIDIFILFECKVKESEAYEAVATNTSGSTPRDLFEDVAEELEKKVDPLIIHNGCMCILFCSVSTSHKERT